MLYFKNLFSLLLLICFSLISSAQHTLTAADVVFSDGKISRFLGDQENIIIPSIIDGQAVRTIGPDAFIGRDHENLKTVSLPYSVTSIGLMAFYDLYDQVQLPATNCITFFGRAAIMYNYTLPNHPMDGSWSFGTAGQPVENYKYQTQFTPSDEAEHAFFIEEGTVVNYYGPGGDVVIPESYNGQQINSIAAGALQFHNITSVTLPSSIVSIEPYAFTNNLLIAFQLPSKIEEGEWNIGESGQNQEDLEVGYYFKPKEVIAGIFEGENFSLNFYPNPSENLINTAVEVVNLSIINAHGSEVKFFNHSDDSFDISDLERGLYFIKAEDKSGATYNSTLIKK